MKVRITVLLSSGAEIIGDTNEITESQYQEMKSLLEESITGGRGVLTTDPCKYMGTTSESILRAEHISGYRITHL